MVTICRVVLQWVLFVHSLCNVALMKRSKRQDSLHDDAVKRTKEFMLCSEDEVDPAKQERPVNPFDRTMPWPCLARIARRWHLNNLSNSFKLLGVFFFLGTVSFSVSETSESNDQEMEGKAGNEVESSAVACSNRLFISKLTLERPEDNGGGSILKRLVSWV